MTNLPSSAVPSSHPSTDVGIIGFSADKLNRAPLQGVKRQYQSKAFTVTLALNPLVASASALLMMARELRQQFSAPDITVLHGQLTHEVHALESRAHELGYRTQVLLASRYLLCALLDEIIMSTSWGSDSGWEIQSLLRTFQNEAWGGERFFIILERAAEEPGIYIDLLELGYLCLSLGFQGRYAGSAMHRHRELASFIDHLYNVIRYHRGEFSRHLLVAPPDITDKPPTRHHRRLPWWAIGLLAIVISAAIFIPYYQQLNQLIQPIAKQIQQRGLLHER